MLFAGTDFLKPAFACGVKLAAFSVIIFT